MGKPIIADKKELLAQSSYLTRLNSQGCRETSRNKTAYIVSVTFNSQVFPKIKDRNSVYKKTTMAKVFQIIPNKEYENVVKDLDDSEFQNNTDDVANIFRFFDAASKQLICVGYAKYQNDSDQNALQAKPTKLEVRKIKGTTELDVDTIFEHFLHDWAASFDLDDLVILNKEGEKFVGKSPILTKDESELWAAKKACGKDSNSLPWSTYDQGRVMDEPVQKTYSFDKSDIDEDKIIAAYIGPQVFGDDFLKKLDITGKSFRASPFKNSKLFKIYYSPYLDEIDFSNNQINDVENKLMGHARGIGRARKLNREGTKYRTKLEKKGYRKNFVIDNEYPPITGGAPGEGLKLPIQYKDRDIESMIKNVTNGNFGQIEKLADLLAKNGYERYTITKIGNDNIGTIVNAFLNNQDNEDRIKEFQDQVKECHFRLDCKSKKQVQGKESSQDNQNQKYRNTKREQIEALYQELQEIFNEFVKTQYFDNFESKDIVIKDNYETLKKKYINFFIDLQQRIRRSRKGRGKLSINNKKDIEKEYTKNNDSDEEDSDEEDSGKAASDKESRLSRVGNFFMNLWSGFSERFKKKGDNPDDLSRKRYTIENPVYQPAVETANSNGSDAESDNNNSEFANNESQPNNTRRKTRRKTKKRNLPSSNQSEINNGNKQPNATRRKTRRKTRNNIRRLTLLNNKTDNNQSDIFNNDNNNQARRITARSVLNPGIQTDRERKAAEKEAAAAKKKADREAAAAQRKAEKAEAAAKKKADREAKKADREAKKSVQRTFMQQKRQARKIRRQLKTEAAAKRRDKTVREAAAASDQGVINPAFGLGLKKPTVYKTGATSNTDYTNADPDPDSEPEYAEARNNSMPLLGNNSMPPQGNNSISFTPFNQINGTSRIVQPTPPEDPDTEGSSSYSMLDSEQIGIHNEEAILKQYFQHIKDTNPGISDERAQELAKAELERAKKNTERRNEIYNRLLKRGGTKKIKKTKKNVTKKKYAKKVTGLKKRKGKKGKTHRAAKKTGRRYYLKTLKKRK